MLFEPERHEAPAGGAWDAARVQQALQDIVDDLEAHVDVAGRWPLHPNDDEGDEPAGGFKGLYLGTAGVLWTLAALQRRSAVRLRRDPREAVADLHAAYLAGPDSGQVEPSFFMGEAGVLWAGWQLTGAPALADSLHEVVRSNLHHPSQEMYLGASGTLFAAWHAWQATAEPRWRALFRDGADLLWAQWAYDAAERAHLWTQDLYGAKVQYFGAGHGLAGNLHLLLKGASLLDDERRAALYDRCAATLQALATTQGDGANWRVSSTTPRPGRPSHVLQWCHGAPGIISAMADFPVGRSPALEALLQAAGRTVWQAGPLAKGHGLCHGTAGNAHALLALHRRSGDAVWLDRARALAMHALAQCQALRARHGRGRYTLWTGDAGLALVLWQCLQASPGLPALDLAG